MARPSELIPSPARISIRRAPLALIAALAVPALAGCGSSGGGSPAGKAHTSTHTLTSSGIKANTTPSFASPSASGAVRSGVVQVAYRNIAIDPDTLRVKAGTTVEWENFDTVEHNVTSEGGPQSFASKSFGEGGTFKVKLTKPGVVNYECTIHPASMNGSIEVVK